MKIEVTVPEEWTPDQALAMRQLLQHAIQTGRPIITLVRKDASPEQLKEIYGRISALVQETGLQPS